MPELPELEVLRKRLSGHICNEIVKDVKLYKPYILKTYQPNYIKLIGEQLKEIERIGKWIIFNFDEIFLFYHPKLAGNLTLKEVAMRDTSFMINFEKICLLFNETGNSKISEIFLYQDKEEFLKNKKLGVDPLCISFNIEYIEGKMKKDKRALYKILIDQSVFPGIGTAYMNEILFESRLSPFKRGNELKEDKIVSLYTAILTVLKNAINEIEKLNHKVELKEKRDFTKVYRKKECLICSTEIKQVFFSGLTIYYCPNCQTEGKIYKDRRFSLFLK